MIFYDIINSTGFFVIATILIVASTILGIRNRIYLKQDLTIKDNIFLLKKTTPNYNTLLGALLFGLIALTEHDYPWTISTLFLLTFIIEVVKYFIYKKYKLQFITLKPNEIGVYRGQYISYNIQKLKPKYKSQKTLFYKSGIHTVSFTKDEIENGELFYETILDLKPIQELIT